MKHTRILAVFTVIISLFSGTNIGYAQQGFAKLGTTLGTNHPALDALKHFQGSLNEELAIQIFPDSQLGSAQQIMEGLQFGDIELGILPLGNVSRHAPFLTVLGLPYLFKDDTHRAQVLDGPLGKQFLDALGELNLVGLAFLETCSRFFLCRDQSLHTQEDFQDRTIALICPLPESECQNQAYELSLQSLRSMGAHPTILPLETLEASLKSESPDVIEYLPFVGMERQIKGSKFKTLILPAHRSMPTILVAGKRWFDTLQPQTQEAIFRASNTLVRQQREVMKEALRHELSALQAQGIEVAEGEEEGLRQAMQNFYEEMAEQFAPEFEQFLQAVQTLRRDVE